MIEFETSINETTLKVWSTKNQVSYSKKLKLLTSDENFSDLVLVKDAGNWKNLNWLDEPTDSFSSLLIERCKQLRDKYKYLILYFSGGSDSETMLSAFVRAKIPVDEIVINKFLINGKAPLLDLVLAESKINSYKKNYFSNTKITINTITETDLSFFIDNYNWQDSSFNGSIGNFRRMTLPMYKFLNNSIETTTSDNIGHIFAESKPALQKRDDGYYAIWSTKFGIAQWAEWFFTSLDLPQLHIKQCHILKKWYSANKPDVNLISEYSPQRVKISSIVRFRYNNTYQPIKASGLLADLKEDAKTEDSIVLSALKESVPEIYHKYTTEVVKNIIFTSNVDLMDPYAGDLKKPISESFYLGA